MSTLSEQYIHDRGRGPEIRGTRITVYDVMDYWTEGWHTPQIAAVFCLPVDQIQAAVDYIEQHLEEVKAEYEEILERHRNYEYPPDVKRKLEESHSSFQQKLAEFRARQNSRGQHAGDHVGP